MGSVEKRRSSPLTACETVVGTLHDAARAGVEFPEEDDVGVASWYLLAGIFCVLETMNCRPFGFKFRINFSVRTTVQGECQGGALRGLIPT